MEQAREQQHVQGHMLLRTKFDLAVAVLLGLTVMAIAWGAYRAEVSSKDGEHYFNRSDETLGTAHKLELQGDQEVSTYEQLFLQLEQDKAEGRTKAAAYLRRRLITPDLMGAITWWERQPSVTRPATPFVDANPRYHNVYYHRAKQLEGQAVPLPGQGAHGRGAHDRLHDRHRPAHGGALSPRPQHAARDAVGALRAARIRRAHPLRVDRAASSTWGPEV